MKTTSQVQITFYGIMIGIVIASKLLDQNFKDILSINFGVLELMARTYNPNCLINIEKKLFFLIMQLTTALCDCERVVAPDLSFIC